MGQKRSQKDRAYVTASEWREEGGGYKTSARASAFKRLPFYCCAITFQPFEDPVCCGSDGTVMDIVNAVPYVQKHRKHPVTGQPLELRDLIKLHFTKNSDEEFVCPVLGKVFNENSHIVAIKPTGNVYSWEAIQKLCLEPKNLRDLLTDEPFQKKDIIHIQDPLNVSGRNMVEFDHVKRGLNAETTSDEKGGGGGEGGGVNNKKKKADSSLNTTHMSEDLKRALGTLGSLDEATEALRAGGGGKKAQAERLLASAKTLEMRKGFDAGKNSEGDDPRLKSAPRQPVEAAFKPGASTWDSSDSAAAAAAAAGTHITRATTFLLPGGTEFDPTGGRRIPKPYSQSVEDTVQTTGAASRAFTSTFEAPTAKNVRVKRIVQLKPTKKGYVRLHTSAGQLNIELCADLCPKTCENFIALCESGYYNNTVFHRSIKNFMVQGGDPTGTGKGGVSIWGRTFEDEFDSRLTHGGRGVVSMANSGKSTNGSQFFILYKSAHHLDFKHAVFGKVVGGFETLTAIEGIPTDEEDRPVERVEIKKAEVFVNPYKEMLEEEEEEKVRQVNKKKETYQNTTHVSVPGGVGKYIITKNTKLGFDDW